MLMTIWPGDWWNKLESMNTRVDEDNGKSMIMVKGKIMKVWRFPRNNVLRNIDCLILAPTFGSGGIKTMV